jgi:hypothetical protein
MCAIADAARTGVSTRGAVLFTTTFPCHNCAKHIVGAGITNTVYQRPYPKSAVAELYPDSVVIDPTEAPSDKVVLKQFIGITSKRYDLTFEKERLKDERGSFLEWRPASSQPVTNLVIRSYLDVELGAIAEVEGDLPKKYQAALSSPIAKAAE